MTEEKIKKVKCLLVKAESLEHVGRAYKIRCFDGTEAYVSKALVYGWETGYTKGVACWIPEWVLRQTPLQRSHRNYKWFGVKIDGEAFPLPPLPPKEPKK